MGPAPKTPSSTHSTRSLRRRSQDRKALVFSQFADTVLYLEAQLKSRGVEDMAGVTGNSADPTQLAWQFSPHSNQRPGQGQTGAGASRPSRH